MPQSASAERFLQKHHRETAEKYEALGVNTLVVLANLGFAVASACLRTLEDPTLIRALSYCLVGIAGYQMVVSALSYIVLAAKKLCCTGWLFGDIRNGQIANGYDQLARTSTWDKTVERLDRT